MIVMNGRIHIISVIVENDKQAGEEEEKEGGNTTKMEEDFKTSIGKLSWYEWCDLWTLIHVFSVLLFNISN